MHILKQKLFALLVILAVAFSFISFAVTAYANQLPTGNVEGFQTNTDTLTGWALDPDTSSQSLTIHIYLDQPYNSGGQLIGYLTANVPRSDVNTATGLAGDHGFQFTIPKQYEDGVTHTLYIYAIDTQGGDNPQLGNSPFQFKFSAPITSPKPIMGNVEGFKSNTDVLKGWAVDPNNPYQSLAAHFYLDQPYTNGGKLLGYVTANIPRSDVNTVTGLSGDHGFEFAIPKQYEDGSTHTIYVYAINPGGGSNPLLAGSPYPFQINALGNGSISAPVNGSTLTLKANAWVAGAITSLNYRGVEFMDSYDHGRELQSAVQFDDFGECYNPTEGGARDDGVGSTSTSILKAFNASGNIMTSTNQMAFWLAPGETSPSCGSKTTTAQNTTKLSDYILDKSVSIGFQNLPNVIKYTASFTLPRAHQSAVFAPVVGYTPSSFSEFWIFDTKSKQASQFNLTGILTEQGSPTIFTTPDHNLAIGIYSPVLPDMYNLGYAIGRYGNDVTNNHSTNEFGCVNREYNLSAKQYSYTCYVVVGTFNEVTASLKGLVDYFHPATTISPTTTPTSTSPTLSPTPTSTSTSTPASTLNQTPTSIPSSSLTAQPSTSQTTTEPVRLVNDQGTFYLVIDNQKQGITNPGMLYSYGFEFKDAKPALPTDALLTTAQLLLPGNGSLVKSSNDPTIWLISSGKKFGFVSSQVFLGLGFKFSSVLTVTAPELEKLSQGTFLADVTATHLDGVDVNDRGTIYWLSGGKKYGYPSMEVYNSWHKDNDFSRVVPANSADMALPYGGAVSMRVLN